MPPAASGFGGRTLCLSLLCHAFWIDPSIPVCPDLQASRKIASPSPTSCQLQVHLAYISQILNTTERSAELEAQPETNHFCLRSECPPSHVSAHSLLFLGNTPPLYELGPPAHALSSGALPRKASLSIFWSVPKVQHLTKLHTPKEPRQKPPSPSAQAACHSSLWTWGGFFAYRDIPVMLEVCNKCPSIQGKMKHVLHMWVKF